MKEGESCNLCLDTLTEACSRYGTDQPEICSLKEEYVTDTNMTSDDLVVRLTGMMTPEQRQTVSDALVDKTPEIPPPPTPQGDSVEMA